MESFLVTSKLTKFLSRERKLGESRWVWVLKTGFRHTIQNSEAESIQSQGSWSRWTLVFLCAGLLAGPRPARPWWPSSVTSLLSWPSPRSTIGAATQRPSTSPGTGLGHRTARSHSHHFVLNSASQCVPPIFLLNNISQVEQWPKRCRATPFLPQVKGWQLCPFYVTGGEQAQPVPRHPSKPISTGGGRNLKIRICHQGPALPSPTGVQRHRWL